MNRLVLVSGGTRGIGAAICVRLKSAGYRVIANFCNDQNTADQFAAQYDITSLKFDVSSLEQCQQAIAQIQQDMGPIEVLVNNAGITRDGTLHKMPSSAWLDVINTNLTSCYNLSHAVLPGMRDGQFGRIVNISSINGLAGQFGQCNYSAAKAGMIGFTKALALECAAKGITVNAIAPGYIATEMVQVVAPDILDKIVANIPVGRLGRADEVARCVEFLIADASGFITGSTLAVNGGQHMA